MNKDTTTLTAILRCADGVTAQIAAYTSAHGESLAARLALAHALGLCDQLHELDANAAVDIGADVSTDEMGPCACAAPRSPKQQSQGVCR